MTARIIPKRSTTAGVVPNGTSLLIGELAVNAEDGIIFTKLPDGSVVNLSGAPELHNHQISQVEGLQTALDSKVDKVTGKGLSTEDYTTTEKNKLAGVEAGAQVNVATDLSQTRNATTYTLISSAGLNTILQGASGTQAGILTSSDKTKLDGIETGAQVNTVDSVNSKTGAVSLSTTDIGEGTNLYFTDLRATTAIKNDIDWKAGNWNTAYSWGDHSLAGYELASNKGVANGYASLGGDGKVPSAQLPSFVDDVLEYSSQAAFPTTGEAGKMYVALDTNKVYRWSGTTYIYITSGAVDSVNGYTGVISLSTSDISEGTNQYFTNSRARNALSASGDLSYNVTTGDFSFSETYSTPTELLTAVKTVDGATSGLDTDLLDGQHGAYYLDYNNFTNLPTYDNYGSWNLLTDSVSRGGITSGENVNFVGGTNVSLSFSTTNNTITINSTDTNTTYSAGVGITLTGTTFSLTGESYTSAEKTKLSGIEAGAQVNTVTSVNTKTGAVVLNTDDVAEGATNLYYTDARASAAAPVQTVNGQTGNVTIASGGISWSIANTNFTAEANNGYLVDCSAGATIVTLPPLPAEGDTIGISDFTKNSENNNITLARNGENISGFAEDLVLNIDGAGFTLVYTNASIGWEIVSEIGTGGKITVSTTAPLSPNTNDIWMDIS